MVWFFLLVFPGAMAAQKPAAPSSGSAVLVPGNFVDITGASGVHFKHMASHTSMRYSLEMMGSGVALFDYNNDGRLDIFFVNGAEIKDPNPKGVVPHKINPQYWNRLYRQKEDGTFEDVTEKAGLQGVGYGMGVAVGDYDNDGFEDLYVTAYGGNSLYHNNGDGTFTDVTEKAGVAGSGWSTSAAWVDLDNNGLLDLVVLRYFVWDFDDLFCPILDNRRSYCDPKYFKAIAPLVYHNDGGGHFTEVGQKTGLGIPGKGLGIAIADYDRDGHIDIFIANDGIPEALFHNRGDGTFEETALLSNAAVDGNGRAFAGMGVDFVDYNNDGLPDLIVGDLASQTYALYQNHGDGTFDYATVTTGLGRLSMQHSAWGLHFLDYDNDGWKDLLLAQGHVNYDIQLESPHIKYLEPMLLLRNTGKGFADVSAASGSVFQEAWAGRGLATGDLDNDGRIDAVVATNDGWAHVLHNETKTANHWLTLNLIGHKSNRDAIGAGVTLTTTQGLQYATVTTAGSYASSSDKRVHFGLGADTAAKTIEIRWPSGIVQTLRDVAGDRILQIDEPAANTLQK